MSETVVITVLVGDSASGRDLGVEGGLAFHIEAGEDRLLFDTGSSALLVQNARRLGLNLSQISAVALSHGHFDHTGGLPSVWSLAPDAELYAHPAALAPHFTREADGTTRDVGIGKRCREALRRHRSKIRQTRKSTEMREGLFLTGEIPRIADLEGVDDALASEPSGVEADPILDDQALFFDTHEGLVVLLGCAHSGVANTLDHIRQLTDGRPIRATLGGMHLEAAGSERVAGTVEALRKSGVEQISPAHCTGAYATSWLWREFPRACTVCSAGTRFVFQR